MRTLRFFMVLAVIVLTARAENRKERLEWFRDAGFGLFIHWGVDSQLGSVISHSLVGASDEYVQRFFLRLPTTFQPNKFNPQQWAVLAKLAGFKYVMFTTKHHSGFCMFDTRTTNFNVMHTPFGKDIAARIFEAFRGQGIAPGVYFSPDDFHYLYEHGITITRNVPEVSPEHNAGLLQYDQTQLRELLQNYGKIDLLFLDGPPGGLKELAWKLQPDIVVTRGAIQTPEQQIPGMPIDGPWESCITMGTQWQYKPTNEHYKSGTELIDMLIETRAKGGNLLLNIGPKPDGEIPIEQQARLREIALWMFVNSESIYGVRPWVITNEKNIWFTRKKNEDTVYAYVTGMDWKLGDWQEFTLRSVRGTKETTVTVLGQSDKVLEYRPHVVPRTSWWEDENGFHIKAMRAQRLYNDRQWPDPVVLKITHAQAGMTAPEVTTSAVVWNSSAGTVFLKGFLKNLGNARSVQTGFQYRKRKGLEDVNERTEPWQNTSFFSRTSPGEFRLNLPVRKGLSYDFRAVVKHPLVTIYGKTMNVTTK